MATDNPTVLIPFPLAPREKGGSNGHSEVHVTPSGSVVGVVLPLAVALGARPRVLIRRAGGYAVYLEGFWNG